MSLQDAIATFSREIDAVRKDVDKLIRTNQHFYIHGGPSKEVTIDDGEITAGIPNMRLLPETGTADDLDFINANGADGKFIILRVNNNSNAITVRDYINTPGMAGNINLRGTQNKVLSDTRDTLYLFYSEQLSQWLQMDVDDFLNLSDTPDDYATFGGYAVAVKGDESGLEFIPFPSGGVDEFIELTDAPSSYTGAAGLAVAVNATEDGLEFIPFPSGGVDEFVELIDAPSSYTGFDGYVVAVNATEDGLEFVVLDDVAFTGDYNDLSNLPSIPTQYTDEMAQDAIGAALVDSSTVDFTYTDGTNQITASVIQSALDHGSIGGLTDDDHTQYALLAGRAAGQTLKGGTASGENLTLISTNHATKGKILFGTSAYDEVNNRLGVNLVSPVNVVDISQTSDTGSALAVLRDKASANENAPLVSFIEDNAGADETALYVRNDGSGLIGHFVGSRNGSVGLKFDNLDANVSAHARVWIDTLAGAGDAFTLYSIGATATESWAVGIDNSDGDKFKVSDNNNLGTNDRITIDSNGDMTIHTGTLYAGSSSTWYNLHHGVYGGLMNRKDAPVFYLTSNAYYDGAWKKKGSGVSSMYGQETGDHIFDYAATGAANASITWLEGMRILATGGTRIRQGMNSAGENVGLGGVVISSPTTVTQTGTTGTLLTLSIPANTLGTDGDTIEFEVLMYSQVTAANPTFSWSFGGTGLGGVLIGAGTYIGHIRGTIWRITSTTIKAILSITTDYNATPTPGAVYGSATVTLSNANNLVFSYSAVGGSSISMQMRAYKVRWEPVGA